MEVLFPILTFFSILKPDSFIMKGKNYIKKVIFSVALKTIPALLLQIFVQNSKESDNNESEK